MSDDFSPAIRRARIQQLTIYEISEEELKVLESGSPVSLHLNFAIFLISVAISFATTLATATFETDRMYTVFVVILVISSLIGAFLLILWFKERKTGSYIAESVRNRLNPEGELLPLSNKLQPSANKE